MKLSCWTFVFVCFVACAGAAQIPDQLTRRKANAVDFVRKKPTVEFRRLPGGRHMTSEHGHVDVPKETEHRRPPSKLETSMAKDAVSISQKINVQDAEKRQIKRLTKKLKKMKTRVRYLEESVMDLQRAVAVKLLPALQVPAHEIDVNERGEIVWKGKHLRTSLESGVILRDQTSLVIAHDGLYAVSGKFGNVTVALRVVTSPCQGCQEIATHSCNVQGIATGLLHLQAGDRVSVQVCWRRLLSVPLDTIHKAELWLRMM